jgi:hypothetical protein
MLVEVVLQDRGSRAILSLKPFRLFATLNSTSLPLLLLLRARLLPLALLNLHLILILHRQQQLTGKHGIRF